MLIRIVDKNKMDFHINVNKILFVRETSYGLEIQFVGNHSLSVNKESSEGLLKKINEALLERGA